MLAEQNLIPAPPIVRDHLAKTVRKAQLLRSLLRLAIQAEKGDRNRSSNAANSHELSGNGKAVAQ